MSPFSFPYRTSFESIALPPASALEIERLASLDETIDAYFAEYERSGRAELFEDHCPYFGVPWPAGRVLAGIAARELARWQGRAVLELGCGLALPALLLARAGVRVTATDLHPDVPAFLERNIARNGLAARPPHYLALDWRDEAVPLPAAEVVIGSDVLYDRRQPEALRGLLRRLPWQEAIFTDPGRGYWDSFLTLARAEGWGVVEELVESVFVARLKR
jgi:predicted nicotinamide N-methyase